MTRLVKLASAIALSCLAVQSAARAIANGGRPIDLIKPYKREILQDIVTWDENSLFVHGKRIFLYSGEFHPYRLPVPSLWLDVFQKIKAMGYNGVSFYVDWALLEGKPGTYRAEGVFAMEPFYEAAMKAGIYLIARPGPYINAEVSGGGFPGWLQRNPGILRTRDEAFLNATDLYMSKIGASIAKAQITNGGPVILVQPENEYTGATEKIKEFPDAQYFGYVEKQLRDAGIVVPLISNDASAKGYFAPGKEAAVDIYGHDGYPLGFNCANPTVWPDNALPTTWRQVHMQQSPSTPFSLVEFQGGAFDPWGGPGFDKCGVLVNAEFERVFYKNNYAFGVTIFNLYMTYGGTNWGNLGHPGGYTSYDYSSVIREDRRVDREKYSEQKLQANFFKVTPSFLTASRGNASTTAWTNTAALTVTPALSNETGFYITRHTKYNSLERTAYKLNVQTKKFGKLMVPQGNTTLMLNGRDSKIHVSDYNVGGLNLIYSTGEIFTWHKYPTNTVVLIYGGPGETHELAVEASSASVVEGTASTTRKNGYTIINWEATSDRKVVKVNSNVYIYLLDRNSAYNYWSVDQAPFDAPNPVILQAGYLMRTAKVSGNTLSVTGDLNTTTSIEIIGGAPEKLHKLTFNNEKFDFKTSKIGTITANIDFPKPRIAIPKLNELKWKYLDTLPEIQPNYDDSKWTKADLTKTYNTLRKLSTPTSLYASDYGYHTGTLLFRGHFTATGVEKTIYLHTQGGSAFGMSAYLNNQFLGSFTGFDAGINANSTFTLPNLASGKEYVVTVVIDNMGLDEDWTVGTETMKNPRGILNYELSGREQSAISWKLTGNLGGEDYRDISRGPLNEGGLYAERQGFHLPGAPTKEWKDSKGPVLDGLKGPGIGFFATEFDLRLPDEYDIPLSFTFENTTSTPMLHSRAPNGTQGSAVPAYRVQLFVNGWQFGKYVNNVGPQTKFPVPEGIFNYHGKNYVAVSLWGLDGGETKIQGLELGIDDIIWSGFGDVKTVEGERWEKERRRGAY
ncbi:hypothetical protein GQ43DRAFT_186375 [Delitschia confertaspora ATCC 74209]|uniref:Beta-galactosidase n=1 Tax=Delitschia confertaspora ATCC 74209 TaxID=1513339 RepID=A0A9P4JEN8_9PLEO|nr:hypothetical protein GQ43DRAFT_186375 [Delitschia confertaspora ATCC 74209]